MNKENIDFEFEAAYELASKTIKKIAPDDMLKIYAYYKQATYGSTHIFVSNENDELIRAFKFNAWQQVRNLTQMEAKKEYIKLIKKLNL